MTLNCFVQNTATREYKILAHLITKSGAQKWQQHWLWSTIIVLNDVIFHQQELSCYEVSVENAKWQMKVCFNVNAEHK